MSMLSIRLQVLIDESRARRLDAEAARRNVSVATLVREGIDAVLPQGPTPEERNAGIARLLARPKLDMPSTVEEINAILAEANDGIMPEDR